MSYTKSWEGPGSQPDSGEFRVWETQEGPPSHSVPPHLVAKAAARIDPQAFDRMHDRLMHAYFAENRDITHPDALRTLWTEVGLPDAAFVSWQDPEILRQVLTEHHEAREQGAGGVPAFRMEHQDSIISGAQPVELFRRWITRQLDG